MLPDGIQKRSYLVPGTTNLGTLNLREGRRVEESKRLGLRDSSGESLSASNPESLEANPRATRLTPQPGSETAFGVDSLVALIQINTPQPQRPWTSI